MAGDGDLTTTPITMAMTMMTTMAMTTPTTVTMTTMTTTVTTTMTMMIILATAAAAARGRSPLLRDSQGHVANLQTNAPTPLTSLFAMADLADEDRQVHVRLADVEERHPAQATQRPRESTQDQEKTKQDRRESKQDRPEK